MSAATRMAAAADDKPVPKSYATTSTTATGRSGGLLDDLLRETDDWDAPKPKYEAKPAASGSFYGSAAASSSGSKPKVTGTGEKTR